MSSLKNATISIVLLIMVISTPLCYCSEQTAEPELNLEIITRPIQITRQKTAKPSILPTHGITFTLEWHHREPTAPDMEAVLQTAVGKSVSQLQREFLKATKSFKYHTLSTRSDSLMGIKYISGSTRYELHAVSMDDARKIAKAFIQVLLRENNAAIKPLLDDYLGQFHKQKDKYQLEIAGLQTLIPEKEQQLKELKDKYTEVKNERWYQSTDQAENAILQLNAIHNTERIELAGLLAKRKAIEKHREIVEMRMRNNSDPSALDWGTILMSLEQKHIDLMIDLDMAKAREETALTLRQQAHTFLDLDESVKRVSQETGKLKDNLSRSNSNLRAVEQMLAQPRPPMLPLGIYKNKVCIHQIRVSLVD